MPVLLLLSNLNMGGGGTPPVPPPTTFDGGWGNYPESIKAHRRAANRRKHKEEPTPLVVAVEEIQHSQAVTEKLTAEFKSAKDHRVKVELVRLIKRELKTAEEFVGQIKQEREKAIRSDFEAQLQAVLQDKITGEVGQALETANQALTELRALNEFDQIWNALIEEDDEEVILLS